MADVLNIDDYRPDEVGPVQVTFFAPKFKDESDRNIILSYTVNVADGDYEGIIDAVRQNGGVFVPPMDGRNAWFLPWPCAAVRIRPLDEEPNETL